jgi:hypothetical protein
VGWVIWHSRRGLAEMSCSVERNQVLKLFNIHYHPLFAQSAGSAAGKMLAKCYVLR